MKSSTCMCVHAWMRSTNFDVKGRGMHLHYHLFWPPVTETIWTFCQNLIREWKRPGGGGEGGLKQRVLPFQKETPERKAETESGDI